MTVASGIILKVFQWYCYMKSETFKLIESLEISRGWQPQPVFKALQHAGGHKKKTSETAVKWDSGERADAASIASTKKDYKLNDVIFILLMSQILRK